jgi:polyisoprenoid-binding protein YceI
MNAASARVVRCTALVVAAALGLCAPDSMHAQQAPEAAALPSPGLAAGATYVIDRTHTFVVYEIGHYATSTNRGRFGVRGGTVRIDADGRTGTIDITIDVASVSTGVDALDRHLQSREFLDVAAFPVARFAADRIVVSAGGVGAAEGALTLKGVTRPVALQGRRFNCYVNPELRRQVCGGDFETRLRRSEFGIDWGLGVGFDDEVRLLVQVEAVRAR